jgi:hypothetical protein
MKQQKTAFFFFLHIHSENPQRQGENGIKLNPKNRT